MNGLGCYATAAFSALHWPMLPASVVGNELSERVGSGRWIKGAMIGSACVAVLVGVASVAFPAWAILALLLLYGFTTAAESGALTAGVVARAPPERRGKTMAVYSMIGFAGAVAGPLVFGSIVNASGPDRAVSWALAFVALGAGVLVGPLALAVLSRDRQGFDCCFRHSRRETKCTRAIVDAGHAPRSSSDAASATGSARGRGAGRRNRSRNARPRRRWAIRRREANSRQRGGRAERPT